VPDPRLEKLKSIYDSQTIIPTTVEFVDIAGLVKGAASGQGLGNQFLSNIREVDVIIHVLRCFEDPSIETVSPLDDYNVIATELVLKDLESLQKRKEKITQLKKSSKADKQKRTELEQEEELVEKLETALDPKTIDDAKKIISDAPVDTISLISTKKHLIVANIDEGEIADDAYLNNPHYQKLCEYFGASDVIPVSAKLEHELSQLDDEEAKDMADMMGLQEPSLHKIIAKTYEKLNLMTFFTCGPKEIHAWSVKKDSPIQTAAGKIHTDLERGFICAEVHASKEIIDLGSMQKLKDAGSVRTEGRSYIVQDGDIINVRFNV
jgi:GTP-binding protein YchF